MAELLSLSKKNKRRLSQKDQKALDSARSAIEAKIRVQKDASNRGDTKVAKNLQSQINKAISRFNKNIVKYRKTAAQVPVVPLPRLDSPRTNGKGTAKKPLDTSEIGEPIVAPNLKVIKKKSAKVTKEKSPQEFVKSILKGLERPPIEKKKVDTPASQKQKAKEATFRKNLKDRELADRERREAAKRSSDRSEKFAQKIKERKPKDSGESAVSEYMRVSKERRAEEKSKEDKKAVTPEVPESRSGLAQFWKDIKDLPSNLAKDFLPKQIKGSKEEGYTQEREDMGPGKRKYKWGDMEFTLDTTREEMTKGRPTESHKKGGRIKKGAKKTKARKRAALRGHRAELRGG